MKKKVLPRVFFDVEIAGSPAGRIVIQLFSDTCTKTAENFRCLCTGERGIGDVTGKPLHYKGVIFHRVVRDFMIQAGDFSEGNGRGGESIYGGYFADEAFEKKHDTPFLLSMANRGKDTNGSQFFITTQPTPHLDGVHVVFGKVVDGESIVKKIEAQPTDANSRPRNECKIVHCGELVLAKTKKVKAKKDFAKDSEDDDSDKSSKESSSDSEEESKKKKKKKKKKKHKKEKKKHKHKEEKEEESSEEAGKEEADASRSNSFIKAEEVPPVPEQKFLMRSDERRDGNKTDSTTTPASNRSQGRQVKTRSGRKVKGRGVMRYRTPSRSRSRSPHRGSYRSRRGSETPPHWREAQRGQRPLREVAGGTGTSPESGKWRQNSRSPAEENGERNNRVVTSPWACDEEVKVKRKRKAISEGEWSDIEKRSEKEYEEGELREDGRPTNNQSLCTTDETSVVAGPALPPGYKQQSHSKGRHSAKSKSSKRNKKLKKSHKKKTMEEKIASPREETIPTPANDQDAVTENPVVVDEPVLHKSPPEYPANVDVTKSKWDSTEEEEEQREEEKVLVSDTCTELPEAPDALVASIEKQHASSDFSTDNKLSSEQNRVIGKQSKPKAGTKQAKKKRKTSTGNTVKPSPLKKYKAEGSGKAKPDRACKGSSARLFEQARNVLLKAEAELAAIGYRGATDALKRQLRRSRSYSSHSSRSRSTSSDRGRRRKYARRRRGSSRSLSRSSHRRRRYSSDSSSYLSPARYYESRKSSRKSSSYRKHSYSSYSRSSRSNSRSQSSHSDAMSSKRQKSFHKRNNRNSWRSDDNSSSRSPGLPTRQAKLPKNSGKDDGAEKTKIVKEDGIDPYSEKSRLRNKIKKNLKQVKLETPSSAVTAASVRKAEKAKKLKKMKAKKLMWQPPIEFGEEEESFEEIPYKGVKKKKGGNQVEADEINGDDMKDDEIDKMLSSGMEDSSKKIQEISGNIFKKRAQMLLKFKKTRHDSQDNSELEKTPSKSGSSGAVQKNTVIGFGKMEKLTNKPKPIEVKSEAVSEEPAIQTKKKDPPKSVDVDNIWPEDKPAAETVNTITQYVEKPKEKPSPGLPEEVVKKESTPVVDDGEEKSNKRFHSRPLDPVNIKSELDNTNYRPFRVQQYNLAREDTSSSESEEEWVPSKLQPAKKTITFNIKLPQPAVIEDKNNNETNKVKNEEGPKKKRKHKKKKKERKKSGDTVMSLEMLAKTLHRHRQQQKEEKDGENAKAEEKSNFTTNSTTPPTTSTSASVLIEKPASTIVIAKTGEEKSVNSNPASNATTLVTRLPVPTPNQGPYQMRGHMRMPHIRGPRGYLYPPYSYQNVQMMRHMGMRYPMPHAMMPVVTNMVPMPVNVRPPPLPKENFPSRPPQPKEKKKLTDKDVSNLFKKKLISAERLTSLLEKDDEEKEVKLPSPAPSHGRQSGRNHQRSYRRRRHSSSDSYSSYSSRSRSRGRSRSRSSYTDSDRSSSRSSDSSQYSSYSDRSGVPRECRHRSRRAKSSSRSYYSSRSHSRSRSHERKPRHGGRSRSSSSSEYSSRSRSRSRSYSQKRSNSRKRSHDSKHDLSSG